MAAVTTQLHARFRADDGGETSATWLAAEDANISIAKGVNRPFRIRFVVDVNGAPGTPTVYVLRFSTNGGAYADVDAATSGIKLVATTQSYSDHDATTAQLTAPVNGDTYVAGTIQSNDKSSSSVSLSNTYTELEYIVQSVDTDISINDTFDFRVYINTPAAFDAYSVTPRVTIIAAPLVNRLPLLGVF